MQTTGDQQLLKRINRSVLLRLLRGTGIEGLRAMATRAPLPGAPGTTLLRPLLRITRTAARCCRIAHEHVAPRGQFADRLVQVPAAGHDVFKRRAAHEGGVVTGAAQRLSHRAAKQHHVVGGNQRVGGIEHRLDLARTEFDFE